jgi:hypothetical protein
MLVAFVAWMCCDLSQVVAIQLPENSVQSGQRSIPLDRNPKQELLLCRGNYSKVQPNRYV